jgi:hypothetical protein
MSPALMCRSITATGPGRVSPLDHDDFGLNYSKIMNVIDSKSLERDAGGKPVSTFPHPAPGAGLTRPPEFDIGHARLSPVGYLERSDYTAVWLVRFITQGRVHQFPNGPNVIRDA